MCAHVLIAEDNAKQADIVRRYLESDGHTSTIVRDGLLALDAVRSAPPDLLLLDLTLPGLDGLEVCRRLRGDKPELPVLMLTARADEADLLRGLDLGADDYMTKPYSPHELRARVRALLRRGARTRTVRRVGAIEVDEERREVSVGGVRVPCTRDEFEILLAMAAEPGRVFTRAQLLERTGGYGRDSTHRAIDVHVMNLRRKIEADPRRPCYLVTVFAVGYKLAAGAS
ncbi:response regulator transcription factor [Streptosporangium sp. NPDC020072]|uniref:response regulator transcription factor n=1 Tax=Streptosporangium sp. NPDC020072 TaxID=3154788 RepID=UPI003416DAF1